MAGGTPAQAVVNYVGPIQKSLSCVTRSVVVSPRGYEQLEDDSEGHALVLNRGVPVRLSGRAGITLDIKQRYRIQAAEEERGPFKVSILRYMYTIGDVDGREIIAYHWHPDGHHIPWPHMHLEQGLGSFRPEFDTAHLPTGRIAIEDVIRLLITSFGVKPLNSGWEQVLDDCQTRFERWRTWGGSGKRLA